jgi:hypothetical protein
MGHLSRRRALACALLPLLGACSVVPITPAAIRQADAPQADRERAVQTLTAAVARCNEFMASPFRHALPPGHFVLDDVQGLRFETAAGTWPIEIRCTDWGDVVLSFGFQAQEGEGGFTVGEVEPERDRLIDNSLLRDQHGWEMDSDSVADLILHETTHVVSDEGAIGFWKSAGYYVETVFLFRYDRSHSDERRAYSTGEEYHAFIQSVGRGEAETARLLAELDAHIAQASDDTCHHEPPPTPRPPPLPAATR